MRIAGNKLKSEACSRVRQVLPMERTLRIPGALGLPLSEDTSEVTIVEGASVMAALQKSAYGDIVAGLWSWRRKVRTPATALAIKERSVHVLPV